MSTHQRRHSFFHLKKKRTFYIIYIEGGNHRCDGSEMALPSNSRAMLYIQNLPLVGASKEGFSVRLPSIGRLNLDSLVFFWNTNELITEHK